MVAALGQGSHGAACYVDDEQLALGVCTRAASSPATTRPAQSSPKESRPLPSGSISVRPPTEEKAISVPFGDGRGEESSSSLCVNWVRPVPLGLTA